jgi:mevalonate kinase
VVRDLLGALRDEWNREGRSFPVFQGCIEIESTIPIGAGLGSSAALCVALSRWLREPLGIREEDLLAFSTRLEHRFHGRSSGMDVATILSATPISFVMGRGPLPLGIRRTPRFTFHDTNFRCRTSDAVLQVSKFNEDFAILGSQTDRAMGISAQWATEGLVRYDAGDSARGLELIGRAMKQAHECFTAWKLVPRGVETLLEGLYAQGAIAAKLTGAGGGGFVVALWPDSL